MNGFIPRLILLVTFALKHLQYNPSQFGMKLLAKLLVHTEENKLKSLIFMVTLLQMQFVLFDILSHA